jgi:fatty acid desaturase
VDELDERLAAVWSATSTGELAVLESDLPHDVREEHVRRLSALQARTAARAGLSGHLLSYLAVMVLLVGIWLAVGLAGGGWYPWPVWPALGWGLAVAGQVRAARAPLP